MNLPWPWLWPSSKLQPCFAEAPRSLPHGGFPKLGVHFLGVPIIRIIVFGGLYWGTPILGNYHMEVLLCSAESWFTMVLLRHDYVYAHDLIAH